MTLIEVLVAIAVISIVLIPIIGLQSQIARSHARNQQRYELATLERNVLSILRDLNPMVDKEGQIVLDGAKTLSWKTTPISEVISNAQYPNGNGPFNVALYQVEAILKADDGRNLARLSIERVGWKRTSETLARLPPPPESPLPAEP